MSKPEQSSDKGNFLRKVSRLVALWGRVKGFQSKRYWTEQGGQTYVTKYPPGGARNEDLILTTLQDLKFQSLLDVGCGYGRYLKVIGERFADARLCGVDISPTQLEEARRYLQAQPGIGLKEVDGLHLPFEDKTFDVCFTYGCMVHVPPKNLRPFFDEICRVTRNQGVFLESNRTLLRTLRQLFEPPIIWYNHDYSALFRHFRKTYRVAHQGRPKPGYVDRLYVVDLG